MAEPALGDPGRRMWNGGMRLYSQEHLWVTLLGFPVFWRPDGRKSVTVRKPRYRGAVFDTLQKPGSNLMIRMQAEMRAFSCGGVCRVQERTRENTL